MIDLPPPPVPADADLRDYPYMPIDIVRLFGSDFHAQGSDAEWRAGFTLWLRSWHQVPAGSLPDDEVALTRLAELGRDTKVGAKYRQARSAGGSDAAMVASIIAPSVRRRWKVGSKSFCNANRAKRVTRSVISAHSIQPRSTWRSREAAVSSTP